MDITLGLLIFGWIFVLIWVPVVVLTQRKTHPKQLFILFFAELWERFSFYGMRSLLTLYMIQELFFSMGDVEGKIKALGIYGSYMAMVYATPFIGGIIADRIVGFKKAIIVGGVLMALGHFALGFEGNITIFYIALALIIVGNGFFKPNISSYLGTFYTPDDPRKDGAFTIFYMGVNIGAFLAPLSCAYVAAEFSWFWGFSLAGIGMLVGLLVFWLNMGWKGSDHANFDEIESERKDLSKNKILGMPAIFPVIIGAGLSIPLIALMLNLNEIMQVILFVIGGSLVLYLLFYSLYLQKQNDIVHGQRLMVVVVLFFFHMIFWALFEQAGGSLTIFAEENVNRSIFGSKDIPTPIFQSLNPLFIMLLAPVFSWIWIKLRKSGVEPRTPMKFVLGLAQLAMGFGVIVIGAKFFGTEGMVPLIFLVVMYLLHTTGELSLSPVGLSMVTKLAPGKLVGFVMGAWFMSIALAHEVAAIIGKLTASPSGGDSLADSLVAYSNVYMVWGVLVVGGASLLLLVLVKPLNKMMNGIH